MTSQSSDRPASGLSLADFPIGSPESRAAARLMAENRCTGHGYRTNAEAYAAAELHRLGLVSCPFGGEGPFLSLEGVRPTDATEMRERSDEC